MLIRNSPLLRLPLGFLVRIAFFQPSCGFSVCLFSMFVGFVFGFFSSVQEILLCTTTFCILDSFQKLAEDFFVCLFLRKKACFLTDMIFCNTSILKYRRENDIF